MDYQCLINDNLCRVSPGLQLGQSPTPLRTSIWQPEGWMDEWMDGRMDRRTDGRTDRRKDGWTNRWTDRRMVGWMDGQTDGSMEGWMAEGQTDRRTDGWTDRWTVAGRSLQWLWFWRQELRDRRWQFVLLFNVCMKLCEFISKYYILTESAISGS